MMDNYIKRVLKVKCYVRYVDDFVLFANTKDELVYLKKEIEIFLQEKLLLSLRDNYRIRKVETGIDFLGYIIRPKYNLVRNRVVNNYKFKKRIFLKECFFNGTCSEEDAKRFKNITASYYGHFKYASSDKLMKKLNMKNWLNTD